MGKKNRRKDVDEIETIEHLKRGLRQAKAKGDFKEVASIHNQLGYAYRLRGDYEEAIEEHLCEARVSKEHFPNDKTSLGIAFRNIGEVYIDNKEFEEAIPYIEKYLKLAKQARDVVEEQRAHVTLGRISLGLIEKYAENEGNDPDASSKRLHQIEVAKRQFSRANELTEQEDLKRELRDKDWAEMRCGTYLNLGITYEFAENYPEAINWMEKAIALARQNGFVDQNYRCHFNLYGLKMKIEKYDEAYKVAQDVVKAARLLDNKTQEYEARILEAKTLFYLNEVEKGVNILKRTRKLIKNSETASSLLEDLDTVLTAAIRVLRAEDEIFATESSNVEKLKSLYEIKGDNYVTLCNLQEAIKNYHKSIAAAERSGLKGKRLAVLYYSLAETYKDKEDYLNALKYYRKEMEINASNKIEQFKTQINIADCLERAKDPKERILEAYRGAIRLAKGVPSKEIIGLTHLAQYCKSIGNEDEAAKCTAQAAEIRKTSSEPEDDSQEGVLDDEPDEIDLDELSSGESESEEEEERDAPRNAGTTRKLFKTRKNEKGETQLHLAAQRGDIKAVRRLLAQGHEVNPSDYSGWTPLHEACNFGHYEVVVELLKHKADVNNTGGNNSVTNGVTPIHDAANNGHIKVMRALLEHGASPVLRDKEQNRPVDSLVGWYERQRKIGAMTSETIQEYEEMKEYLINAMRKVGKIYTRKDEQAARRKANIRTPSPEFSVMKTGGIDAPVPVTICVVDPDENEGRAGVNEYNEAMNIFRRKENSSRSRPSRKEKGSSTPKKALLAESEVVDEWMIPDEDLAPDTSLKRKRDPFEDLIQSDRNIRRRRDGRRDAVAQMDIVRSSSSSSLCNELSDSQEVHSYVDNSRTTSTVDKNSKRSNSSILQDNDNSNDNEPESLTPVESSSSSASNKIVNDKPDNDVIISDDSDNDEDNHSFRRRVSSSSTNLYDTQESPPSSRSSKSLSSRPRQTKLPFKRVRTVVDVESPPTLSRTPSFSLDRNKSQELYKPLRLKIEILETKILVPVSSFQMEETIEWLCNEVAERYYRESGLGLKPTVTLKTKDGAILSRTDKIGDAISENDIELVAKVDDCTVVALHTRFEATCKKMNLEPNAEVVRSLSRSETTEILILTDLYLRGKVNEALFGTLQHNCCLRDLNVSGCSLRDEGIKRLCDALPTLTQLENLNLSCNGMTHETIGRLVEAFTKTSSPGKVVRPPLGLKTLILNHNPLGNSITGPLCQIIQRLQQLRLMSVVDCNLTAGFFSKNKKDFMNVISGSSIETFDLSYNHLGRGGIQLLTTEVNSNRLHILTKCCE